MTSRVEIHTGAGNLMLAFYVRSQVPEHLPLWQVADERFARLCEAGTTLGLAQSPAELELMVRDVVEMLPAPDATTDYGGAWIWLMQTRWLLARRLRSQAPAVAA